MYDPVINNGECEDKNLVLRNKIEYQFNDSILQILMFGLSLFFSFYRMLRSIYILIFYRMLYSYSVEGFC